MTNTHFLTEGLGAFVRNLATGNVEEEIDELSKEVRDVHTPEQQRYVLTKIVRLLDRLVVLRHNPNALQRFVHDRASWFERMLGNKNTDKEMSVRVGEAIAHLAKLRDTLLARKWPDDEDNRRVQDMRKQVKDILDKAAQRHETTLENE